ncbi:MAG: GH25 family lysozyme [Micromonosporaceae bacterium]
MAKSRHLHPRHDGEAAGPRRRGWRIAGFTLIALSMVSFASIGGLQKDTAHAQENRVRGMDVASHQRNVDWRSWWNKGMRFAYVKATEGTGYKNPYYRQQYNGSRKAGMIRGAYHFALPDRSGGATQARYFVANGGGWTADGKTLPGALDIEYNPYGGGTCYGKSPRAMVRWIKDFSDTYQKKTGRYPTIYSTTNWWQTCTGNSRAFGKTNPLWLARYNTTIGTLPSGWKHHTIWQYSSSPIDQNWFNGSYQRLKTFARGSSTAPTKSPTPKPTPTKTSPSPSESPSASDSAPPTESPAPTSPVATTTKEPELPITGASTAAGGVGAILLLTGGIMLVIGRRRRLGLHSPGRHKE